MLTADDVAARLNIKRETVYAYVSRALLTSHRDASGKGSLFDPLEVERLATRSRRATSKGETGLMFKSALTVIHEGEPHYRGYPVRRLALDHTIEEVAELLWLGTLSKSATPFEPDPALVRAMVEAGEAIPPETLPLERLRALLPVAATLDPMRHDLQRSSVVHSARTVISSMIDALPEQCEASEVGFPLQTRTVESPSLAASLWSRLCPLPPSASLLRTLNTTLVLTADHDLATPSTLTARIAASFGTEIYSVLVAALHTGSGPIQGASSLAIEGYLNTLNERTNVNKALGDRLRHGHDLPGFGHRAYPDGDLRAALIVDLIGNSDGPAHRIARVRELLELQRHRGLPPPNIGFAIAALAYVAGMIHGAGETIFSIARTVGWVAHAIEEYQSDSTLPRQHSVYVGSPPGTEMPEP